jgi:hypothetical protein
MPTVADSGVLRNKMPADDRDDLKRLRLLVIEKKLAQY